MDFSIIHPVITVIVGLVSGGFGAGLTIATFKSDIRALKKSVGEIILKQEILRGNGGNKPPLFIRREECITHVANCYAVAMMKEHTKEIKSLKNFARWSMQNAGLTQTEINNILKDD